MHDVIVLGLGGMGAAALFHLAKRGVDVVGVEQHEIGHGLGSSHGRARVIRKVYFEDPRYVPLLERSYVLWAELEDEIGVPLVHRTGCVNVGLPGHPSMRAVVDNARLHRLPHEILSAGDVMARFPAFELTTGTMGVYESDAGVLPVEQCTQAHVHRAIARGAAVYTGERIVDVDVGAGITVTTDARTLSGRQLVCALGPWSSSTGAPAWLARVIPFAHHLRATRQVQHWFTPPSPAFAYGAFPVFIHFLEGSGARGSSSRAYYGMPPFGGGGVKIARHGGGVACTPDTIDRSVRDDDVDDVRGYVRLALPTLDAAPIEGEVCMYTMTPDEHFAIGRADDVVVLSGFSGHGYKMASVVGEIAADLALAGATGHDIAFFDPRRFA